MKFLNKDAIVKQVNEGLKIAEYCNDVKDVPLDGAVAYMNGSYGPKINHVFTELFFVLEGKLKIDVEGKVYELEPEDMFILLPEKVHTVFGEKVKFFIVCNPPFNAENVEMLD